MGAGAAGAHIIINPRRKWVSMLEDLAPDIRPKLFEKVRCRVVAQGERAAQHGVARVPLALWPPGVRDELRPVVPADPPRRERPSSVVGMCHEGL